MATSVFSHTQTQIHTPIQYQIERRERSIEDDSEEAYDDYDAQYHHEHQYQQHHHRLQVQFHDHKHQEYNHTYNHLPSIPSNEELPGLITQPQPGSEAGSQTEESSPWSTAPPTPTCAENDQDQADPLERVIVRQEKGGETGLTTKSGSKSNLKQVSSSSKGATAIMVEQESADGNAAVKVKEKEANGWIAELDEKLDLVRIEEHQIQQQHQHHDYHQEELRSQAQSQRQRQRRRRSVSAATPVPINISLDISALQSVGGHKGRGTSQTRSRTRTLSQAGTRGQSQVQARAGSRARSIGSAHQEEGSPVRPISTPIPRLMGPELEVGGLSALSYAVAEGPDGSLQTRFPLVSSSNHIRFCRMFRMWNRKKRRRRKSVLPRSSSKKSDWNSTLMAITTISKARKTSIRAW
jgi:hypothetical protein